MKPHLNIQVNLFPFFDGGVYWNVNRGMRMVRLSLAVIDLRLWWDAPVGKTWYGVTNGVRNSSTHVMKTRV